MKQTRMNVWLRFLWIPILLCSITMITGCGGCSDDSGETVAEKEDEIDEKTGKITTFYRPDFLPK